MFEEVDGRTSVMEIIDQAIRDEILAHEGSLVVRASAGSGKTTIMVQKIKKVLSEIDDHKTVVATTFTKKATQEIREKYQELGGGNYFLVTTNDGFVEQEVIRPFINDVYGNSVFSSDNLSDFNNDYLSSEFTTYDSLLKNLSQNKLLAKYSDNHKNFKFELALNIIKNSIACQEYLKYKYQMIFLDEYQDSDKDMHNFFMYLHQHLEISLFIVGDTKQAIYLWRGAREDIFEGLPSTIAERRLLHNFRSHSEIVNYASLIHEPDRFRVPINVCEGHVGICNLNQSSLGDLIMSDYVDRGKEITIIVRRNDEAIAYQTNLMEDYGLDFEYIPSTPIDDNQTIHSHYLKMVAKFYYKAVNIFDFASECGLEISKTQLNKLYTSMLGLHELFPLKVDVDFDCSRFHEIINCICEYLEVQFTQNEIKQLQDTLSNEAHKKAFVSSENKYKIMTVFSAKGLEFDQVIGFGKDYFLNNLNQKNNHYVLVTRAKKKVIVINNGIYKQQIDNIIHSKKLNPGSIYQSFDIN